MTLLIIPVIVFAVALVVLVDMYINWSVHRDMVKSSANEWGKGNFDNFRTEFNKRKWERNKLFPYSWFDQSNILYDQNYIHASIIKFDGKGMILDFISYNKFRNWSRKNKCKIPMSIEKEAFYK